MIWNYQGRSSGYMSREMKKVKSLSLGMHVSQFIALIMLDVLTKCCKFAIYKIVTMWLEHNKPLENGKK